MKDFDEFWGEWAGEFHPGPSFIKYVYDEAEKLVLDWEDFIRLYRCRRDSKNFGIFMSSVWTTWMRAQEIAKVLGAMREKF